MTISKYTLRHQLQDATYDLVNASYPIINAVWDVTSVLANAAKCYRKTYNSLPKSWREDYES